MDQIFVVGIRSHILSVLRSLDTERVGRCVVFSLGVLIVLLVLTLRLNLCYVHVVDKLGVILQASETDLLSFSLFICFFIFVLETEERDQMYYDMAIEVYASAKEKKISHDLHWKKKLQGVETDKLF